MEALKTVVASVALLLVGYPGSGEASERLERARRLVASGDARAARALLAEAASRGTPESLREYAEFLDRFGDAEARAAYARLLEAETDQNRKQAITRRLATLDFLHGDPASAHRRLESLGVKPPAAARPAAEEAETIVIPGPLRSFSRMAAISRDLRPEEVLPAVARNVVTNGYQASSSNDALDQTEYLKLVHRYLSQARELTKLAGDTGVLLIENCESEKVGELLKILGYRMRGGCGAEVVLETVNASRAFLTTDSGFPLAELENALRTNRKFEYPYHPTRIPVLYGAKYWLGATRERGGQAEFIDLFLNDPQLCRLYLGFSKLDAETAEQMRQGIPVQRIKAFSHVLDFFGGMFEIRQGKAAFPGGARAESAWAELVGVPPAKGVEFYEKLLAKDDGWLCSLYDALMRIEGPVQEYLTEPARMKRFYAAVRGRVTSPGPARPVFRSNADMMLLTTRLVVRNGQPHVPGGIEVWKDLFLKHPHGKYDGKLTRLATTWKEPDDVLEALFALTRKAVENEPLKTFMAISDLDRRRAKPLEPATVDRLARAYRALGSQYAIFNDAPSLSDRTILEFLDVATAVSKSGDNLQRGNTAGALQGLIGIWQILSRHGVLPEAKVDETLHAILTSFANVKDYVQIFDAARAGVRTLLAACGVAESEDEQAKLLDLLAGVANPSDTESHQLVVQEMTRVLEAQRIVSLKLIFELADNLEAVAKGEKLNTQLANRVAARLSEIQMPRAALTTAEKNALSFGYWTERHIEEQRKLNLRGQIERAANDPERLKKLRGLLTPVLRDTLVALNYAHYAPPGAQVLYTNPQFVRSHDFLGAQGTNQMWRPTEIAGTGWPANAGGRLVGSLSGLAYALAEAEQNFLVPSQTQALIWGDLVPQMILSAKIPRWWKVTPNQMHWVGLHLRYGRSLVAEAGWDPALRPAVLESLRRQAPPKRVHLVERYWAAGDVAAALDEVTPAEYFAVAADLAGKGGDHVLGAEIRRLAQAHPQEVNYEAISMAFGTPKPTLANSYRPELLRLRTFPTLMGYSSRIMAESWESNTLYWASLADEAYLQPSQLNLLVPEWTQKVVERIFASHLEDWPALLRSLRTVGEDVRDSSRKQAQLRAGAGL